jgi:solute carrier family 50 protein (sugar transporter)
MNANEATNLLACLSNAGTLFLFASPLTAVLSIWNNQDPSPISLPLSILSLLCSVSWSIYGVVIDNLNVILPNLFGVITSILQLVLWRLFPRTLLPTSSLSATFKSKA